LWKAQRGEKREEVLHMQNTEAEKCFGNCIKERQITKLGGK